MRSLTAAAISLILMSCGYYSFSGKSIPPGIKNAQLLLFEDNSGRYDLSLPELLKEQMENRIAEYNYFELENSSGADSRITGKITGYSESVSSQTRDENIDQMVMIISVEVSFFDNGTDGYIIKGHRITESEYFEESGGDEARSEAFAALIERISDKIVLALSSNW